MKKLVLNFVLAALSSVSAASEQQTITIQGQLIVQSFISPNNAIIQGKVLSASEGLDLNSVSATVAGGFAAVVPSKSTIKISNCENSIVVVTAEEGNFIPRAYHHENYTSPRILSFVCKSE